MKCDECGREPCECEVSPQWVRDTISAYQDALISLFVQAGVTLDDGEIDTNQICVSAYEEAFDLLKRAGRVVERKIPRRFMSARKALYFTNAEWCGAGDGSDVPKEPEPMIRSS